jgi:putative transposase
MHIFHKLIEVLEQTEHQLADYNIEIAHDSLGGVMPARLRHYHTPDPPNSPRFQTMGGGGRH